MEKLINITGKALSGEWGIDDKEGIGIPVLRTTNFTNDGIVDYSNVITRTIIKKNIADKFLRKGDIIIEKSGGSDNQPVGRVVYFDNEENKYLFNNFTGLLRVKDTTKWLPKYIFYSLFANYQSGGTRKYENKTTGLHNLQTDFYVKDFEIKEISYSKQIEICELFDKITDLIDKRKKQLEKLDELVKARFVEMFGHKNFPIIKLEKLCNVGSSKRIYQCEQSTIGIPFLRISDLNERIDTGNKKNDLYIPVEKYEELLKQGLVPKENDILVTSRGTLGKCYIVSKEDCFYFQDGMISWLSNIDERISSKYISYLFSMPMLQKQIEKLQTGSTVSYLSIAMLNKLDISVPPIELQNQFADFVEQVDKSKFEIKQSLEKLELLKKALMQKYFG